MSTQFYTDQQTPYQQTPGPQGNGPSRFRTWALVVGAAVAAAIIALASVLAFSHSSTTPATTPSASTSAPAGGGTTPVTPSHPVTPVQPSAAVMQLQRELGQLNYYEGPVDGLMGPQTIAAIKDLQRQAGLPQTGVMNAATQAALANYLAHGNNQMGGNS
jgi:peptidoglycan hydrolase-like protein with peptidoglycan-binding domain